MLTQRHPFLDTFRHWTFGHRRQGHRFGIDVGLAHQLVKRHLLDPQIILGADFLCHGQVVTGLCFSGVCDGGCADFKIALGKGQLFRHCFHLRLDKCQVVLAGKHIEIGLAQTNHQVLLSGLQLGIGNLELQIGL